MHRMLHLSVGWSIPRFDVSSLDPIAQSVSTDWLRYNGNCWLLWSDKTLAEVSAAFRAYLQPADQLMVLAVDRDFLPVGYMPEWIWDWVNSTRDAETGYVHQVAKAPITPPVIGTGLLGLPARHPKVK